MAFYFCGQYINIDVDDKEVEWDMFTIVPYFGVLVIVMDMRSEKIVLKIFSLFL